MNAYHSSEWPSATLEEGMIQDDNEVVDLEVGLWTVPLMPLLQGVKIVSSPLLPELCPQAPYEVPMCQVVEIDSVVSGGFG